MSRQQPSPTANCKPVLHTVFSFQRNHSVLSHHAKLLNLLLIQCVYLSQFLRFDRYANANALNEVLV